MIAFHDVPLCTWPTYSAACGYIRHICSQTAYWGCRCHMQWSSPWACIQLYGSYFRILLSFPITSLSCLFVNACCFKDHTYQTTCTCMLIYHLKICYSAGRLALCLLWPKWHILLQLSFQLYYFVFLMLA